MASISVPVNNSGGTQYFKPPNVLSPFPSWFLNLFVNCYGKLVVHIAVASVHTTIYNHYKMIIVIANIY